MKYGIGGLIALLAVAAVFLLRAVPARAFSAPPDGKGRKAIMMQDAETNTAGQETIIFGAGCFWCVEAVFQRVKGVDSVSSGYMGGTTVNPTYDDVCSGLTGHAEVCRIVYNPSVVSFDELLEIFWKTHDPTTLNRQGNDVGTQYRSAIFFTNDEQRKAAEYYKQKLDSAGIYRSNIVTEITPASIFYKAEDYHQNYYNTNTSQGYCAFVITPKVEKFKKIFQDKYKGE